MLPMSVVMETFGLCDGLITRKGKAVICGCVIAQVVIPPTTREYADHHAWCLHYAKGRCDGCIKRCPASAVNSRGHDKMRCREYCFGPGKDYMREQFGFDEYVCGLCQSAVPCESKKPGVFPLFPNRIIHLSMDSTQYMRAGHLLLLFFPVIVY